MNRGGALFVDHMQYEQYPSSTRPVSAPAGAGRAARLPAPFVLLFIGYDGQYYLCCSDWKKETPMGTRLRRVVRRRSRRRSFATSRAESRSARRATSIRSTASRTRSAALKRGQVDQAQVDKVLDEISAGVAPSHDMFEKLGLQEQYDSLEWAPRPKGPSGRRLIPLTASS